MDAYELSKAYIDAIEGGHVEHSRMYIGRATLAPGFQDYELTPADGEHILWRVLEYLGLWHHIEAGDIIRHILQNEFTRQTKGGLTNG